MRMGIIEEIMNGIKENGNFNGFRKYYDSFSFEELKYVNDEICRAYAGSKQSAFNLGMFIDIFFFVFGYFKRPIRVLELGPHQGHLANQMLSLYDSHIHSWTAYELSKYAIETSVVTSPKYSVIELDDYFYNIPILEYDLFCATHVFEHFSKGEMKLYIDHIKKFPFIALEFPDTTLMKSSWDNYGGTHILIISEREIVGILDKAGFNLFYNKKYQDDWWVSGWYKKELFDRLYVEEFYEEYEVDNIRH